MVMLLNAPLIDFIQLVFALIIFYLGFTVLSNHRTPKRKPFNHGKPVIVNRSAQQ